jgi:hypothetical protein
LGEEVTCGIRADLSSTANSVWRGGVNSSEDDGGDRLTTWTLGASKETSEGRVERCHSGQSMASGCIQSNSESKEAARPALVNGRSAATGHSGQWPRSTRRDSDDTGNRGCNSVLAAGCLTVGPALCFVCFGSVGDQAVSARARPIPGSYNRHGDAPSARCALFPAPCRHTGRLRSS